MATSFYCSKCARWKPFNLGFCDIRGTGYIEEGCYCGECGTKVEKFGLEEDVWELEKEQ